MSDGSVERTRVAPGVRERWRRGQRGWPASYPIAQLPNAPLLIALGGSLAVAATQGSARSYARSVVYAGLSAWAWEEVVAGANLFRRALGAAAFGYVAARLGATSRA
jgi:hypothetical protein